MAATGDQVPWFLQSSRPVTFPVCEASTYSQEKFDEYLTSKLDEKQSKRGKPKTHENIKEPDMHAIPLAGTAFMQGLLSHRQRQPTTMRTANNDVTYKTSGDPLVDLFYDLDDSISGSLLTSRLHDAWQSDPLITLKIIFNARSIHLGKSSKKLFYRCAGWLARHHPQTLIFNLRWLTRPVIEKKQKNVAETDADIVLVDAEDNKENAPDFDVRFGVSHGYWKDLLNILALAAHGKLDADSDPSEVLNVTNQEIRETKMHKRRLRKLGVPSSSSKPRRSRRVPSRLSTEQLEREQKNKKRREQYSTVTERFEKDHLYHVLHLAIARLFADQLRIDIALLRGDDAKAKRQISKCAKWAPSDNRFHDRSTLVTSSIAEMLFPRECFDIDNLIDREVYLRHARERYRQNISALRKYLDVVERKISDNAIDKINYAKVPSIAMNNYMSLFIEKDSQRFDEYLDQVNEGKNTISGATLMPSTLIQAVRRGSGRNPGSSRRGRSINAAASNRMNVIEAKVLDGQWNTLVQRIKDSGSLSSCIAVCDVSGSMDSPVRADGTTPMDSAIGLSLLLAEVTAPPFGGAFITFSSSPSVQKINLQSTLREKVLDMASSDWGMNTDFVAVFERLILPMAIINKVKQEDMVKKVFVFSDMQFDEACATDWFSVTARERLGWSTSYSRIKAQFENAGYVMPELVFWNLAGSRMGFEPGGYPAAASAKPVRVADPGTELVSGYSQAMLKVFMDNGGFEDPADADDDDKLDHPDYSSEDDLMTIDKDGNVSMAEKQVVPDKTTTKADPLKLVKKAVGHKAYEMLVVVD